MNYGKAEGYLERKWPEKYNAAGHIPWEGRLYFKGFEQLLGCFRGRVYQGTWGSALFQSIYQPAPSLLWSLPLMPEWYVIVAALGFFSMLGMEWTPLLLVLPLFLLAAALPVAHALTCASRLAFLNIQRSSGASSGAYGFSAPDAAHGAPDRKDQTRFDTLAQVRRCLRHSASSAVAEDFHDLEPAVALADSWLESVEEGVKALKAVVLRGGDFDGWDLELRGGLLGSVRVLMAVEEHGGGNQYIRVKSWPRCTPAGIFLTLFFAAMGAASATAQAWFACGTLNAIALVLMMRVLVECSSAMSTITEVLDHKE